MHFFNQQPTSGVVTSSSINTHRRPSAAFQLSLTTSRPRVQLLWEPISVSQQTLVHLHQIPDTIAFLPVRFSIVHQARTKNMASTNRLRHVAVLASLPTFDLVTKLLCLLFKRLQFFMQHARIKPHCMAYRRQPGGSVLTA